MIVAIQVTVFTHNDDTEVLINVGSEYGGVTKETFRDPEVAVEFVRDLVEQKWAEGLKEIEKRRNKLVADLAKAQSTLERSGAA